MSDSVKYWLSIGAIMLVIWGYSGKLSTALIFGVAAVGAFIYWRVIAQRRKQAIDAARHQERPRGA
jgi:hypothetical protein